MMQAFHPEILNQIEGIDPAYYAQFYEFVIKNLIKEKEKAERIPEP